MTVRLTEKRTLTAVERFAGSCMGEEIKHTRQVTFLALKLFDELAVLHGLGPEERRLLECAALLHDIGWLQGWKGHHKNSLAMIQDNRLLPFNARERLVVASIARYHRKALPSLKHDHYAALAPSDRRLVDRLAALLRIADGLDRTHQAAIQDLRCVVDQDQVIIRCVARGTALLEGKYGTEKADLFTKTYRKKAVIRI